MSRWKQGWTRGSLFAALNIAAVVAVLMLGAGVAVADPDAAPGDPGGPGARGTAGPVDPPAVDLLAPPPTRWRCRRHLTRWRRRHLTRSRRPRLTRWQCR